MEHILDGPFPEMPHHIHKPLDQVVFAKLCFFNSQITKNPSEHTAKQLILDNVEQQRLAVSPRNTREFAQIYPRSIPPRIPGVCREPLEVKVVGDNAVDIGALRLCSVLFEVQ